MVQKIISALMLLAAVYVIYAGLYQLSFFFEMTTITIAPPKNAVVLTADDPGPRSVLFAKDEEDFTATGSMTLTVRTFNRASQTLNTRISYSLPEALLLQLRAPGDDPVYFPGLDGGIVPQRGLRRARVYPSYPGRLPECPAPRRRHRGPPVRARAHSGRESDDLVNGFLDSGRGNPRRYPDDVYEAEFTISLDPGLNADGTKNFYIELGSYPARIPVDTSVALASALAQMELVTGTPGQIDNPHSSGQWPMLALQLRHDAATVWQARRLVIILLALSAALAIYVLAPFVGTSRPAC